MKIVLVRPNYQSHIITPPLGLGYLASYLKQHAIEAVIVDGLRDSLSGEALFERTRAERPDVVGITCLTAFYHEAVALARRLKAEGMKVILGGVHPTFLPYETLRDSCADFVVRGEGEIALRKLLESGLDSRGIPGVYSRADMLAGRQPEEKGECPADLDALPFPDWEQIDPRSYPPAPHGAIVKNFPIGIVTTTRGCPYECTFCASPRFYDRKLRMRTPENVVDEIEYLVERFGVKEIHFEDDNLTFRRDHVAQICRLLLRRGIKITWACPNGIRADKVDEDLIRLMKQAGCYYFAYGIESANAQILKNVKKRETIETINKAIGLGAKLGISCQGFFIFGLPGETPETLAETIRFAAKSKLSRAQFLILDVLPGSELWETLAGQFQPDWTKNSYKEPEWLPRGLTREDLKKAQSRAFRRFYLNPLRFLRLAASVRARQLKYLFNRLLEYGIVPVARPAHANRTIAAGKALAAGYSTWASHRGKGRQLRPHPAHVPMAHVHAVAAENEDSRALAAAAKAPRRAAA
jgi:anaerobic magnesium-protoporphyrin IX monomethyl ester cyclase